MRGSVQFENTEVFNIDGAMRGMVLPFKGTSDTTNGIIGKNDYRIACNLVKAGFKDNAAHCKFLRQILLSTDITAPLYWWSEFDTYKVGTTADSESTMHTLMREIDTLDPYDFEAGWQGYQSLYTEAIDRLRSIVHSEGSDIEKLHVIKRLLPGGFLQKRHITMNYEVIRNMYKQRKNHRLVGWSKAFVNWVSTLPYNEFITGRGIIGEED